MRTISSTALIASPGMRSTYWSVFALLMALASPAFAQAQVPSSAPSRWEIEVTGGLSLGRLTNGGRLDLPLAGAPIDTSSPVFPSWRVPTWFFGDGAAFLNNVAAEFGVDSRVTPLDSRLRASGLNDAGAPAVSVRARRALSAPYSLEFGVDVMARATAVNQTMLDALAESRETFEQTLRAVLPAPLFTGLDVTGGAAAADGSSREMIVTAAIHNRIRPFGRFVPYATAGGGLVLQVGDLPSATISTRYRFRIQDVVPIDETDTLTLRYKQRVAPVVVVGAGIRRDLSARAGLVIDVRVFTGPNPTTVRLDASPASVAGSPTGFIESATYPNLQFSNHPSTGRVSTLSGSLEDVEVFRGGWVTRGRLSAGVYFTF